MPLTDFDRDHCPCVGGEFDYTVVGAGAAGIMIAVELARRGRKVMLIESGHFLIDSERQKFNAVEQAGKVLGTALWGRYRAIGGTTLRWGGQSLPFSAIDFKKRDWVENSGWPVSLGDLQTYYERANAFLGVDGLDYRRDMFQRFGDQINNLNSALDFHYSKWSPHPDFQRRYLRDLKKSVSVLFNAMTTRMHTDANGRVVGLSVANYSGRSVKIVVNRVVITAGAIEANRLLLANREPNGVCIGDHSGWLGRCFMEHPCVTAGVVEPRDPWQFQKSFNTRLSGGRKFSRRLSLSEKFQREACITQASAGFLVAFPSGVKDRCGKAAGLDRRAVDWSRLILSRGKVHALVAWAFLWHRFVYKHSAQISVAIMLEQEPIRSSCITLSAEKDSFGVSKARVCWDISKKSWQAMCALSDLIKVELPRLDLGTYSPFGHIKIDNPEWKEHLHDVNHHMGGTRMSFRASEGVVDSDLRVWGYENLFVVSTSVFPTGSHSNPTLTMLALGQRWVRREAG